MSGEERDPRLSPTMERQLRTLGNATINGFALVSARKGTVQALRRRGLVGEGSWAPTTAGWQRLARDPEFPADRRETASLLATGSFRLAREST